MENCDMIFLKPLRFEDCVRCIDYIKEDKIVHINLTALDSDKSQRVLDFISGAVHIQEGQIINPGEKIYCSIPKDRTYKIEYREPNNIASSRFDEEEEIVPKYKNR